MGGMFGGGGFGGPMGMMGGGLLPHPDDDEEQKKRGMMGGMLPMMSPMLGAFMSGHPNIGLGMISPGLGLARALGAFK